MDIKTNGVTIRNSSCNLQSVKMIKDTQPNQVSNAGILDSGNRRTFDSGAVRDIQAGKGRCDLMPLEYISKFALMCGDENVLSNIYSNFADFQKDNLPEHIYTALRLFCSTVYSSVYDAILELSKHYEGGAVKYGERNWEKGIPVKSYVDSALRHLTKYLRGDKDEPHDRAFMWNCFAILWTMDNYPELI